MIAQLLVDEPIRFYPQRVPIDFTTQVFRQNRLQFRSRSFRTAKHLIKQRVVDRRLAGILS